MVVGEPGTQGMWVAQAIKDPNIHLQTTHKVYVGSLRDKQVDFVAKKGDRIIYVQSAYLLADEQTIRREYTPLEAIHDHYEKVVVSLDDITLPSNNGIRHLQAWRLGELW